MHYFSLHIGDYVTATAHLSMLEDGAYNRLLRRYYQDEKPLPVDVADCQRIVGARTRSEREAVNAVLREFFTLRDDGWHQGRADEEIGAYHRKAETARTNGKGGGRPKTNQSGFSSHTHKEPTGGQTENLTINHEPSTNEEEEDSEQRSRKRGADERGHRLPVDWAPDDDLKALAAGLGLDVDRVLVEFRDYWRGVPGAKGRKLDWPATFRNRCRELAERRGGRPPPGGSKSPTVAQAMDDYRNDPNWKAAL